MGRSGPGRACAAPSSGANRRRPSACPSSRSCSTWRGRRSRRAPDPRRRRGRRRRAGSSYESSTTSTCSIAVRSRNCSSSGSRLRSTITAAVAGVARDVAEIVRVEAQVERVQDETGAGDAEVRLQVRVVVPGERGDAVAALEPELLQPDRELARTAGEVGVGVAMERAVGEARDDLLLREVRLGPAQDRRKRQLVVHHQAVHLTLLSSLRASSRRNAAIPPAIGQQKPPMPGSRAPDPLRAVAGWRPARGRSRVVAADGRARASLRSRGHGAVRGHRGARRRLVRRRPGADLRSDRPERRGQDDRVQRDHASLQAPGRLARAGRRVAARDGAAPDRPPRHRPHLPEHQPLHAR